MTMFDRCMLGPRYMRMRSLAAGVMVARLREVQTV